LNPGKQNRSIWHRCRRRYGVPPTMKSGACAREHGKAWMLRLPEAIG